MSRKVPKQKPHRSKQDYGTPRAFLDAFESRFGRIVWDLAANAGNSVCGDRYFGPGSRWGEDSLERAWDSLPGVPRAGLRWLNYPFGAARLWMPKVALEAAFGSRLAVLGPAAVATNWFAKYVEGRALVMPIRPRLTFEGVPVNPKTGKVDPFVKDLMLMIYAPDIARGFHTWRWDRDPHGLGTEAAA